MKAEDYYSLGPVTDFKYAYEVCRPFRKDHDNALKWYENLGKRAPTHPDDANIPT